MDRGNAEKIDNNSDSREKNYDKQYVALVFIWLRVFSLFSAFVICWHKFEMSIKTDGRCVFFVCIFYMEMTVHFGSREWILLILSDGVDGSSSANIKLEARSTGLAHNKPSFPLWRCVLSTDRANNNKKAE